MLLAGGSGLYSVVQRRRDHRSVFGGGVATKSRSRGERGGAWSGWWRTSGREGGAQVSRPVIESCSCFYVGRRHLVLSGCYYYDISVW